MRRLQDWERVAIVAAMASGEKRDAVCAEFEVCRSYPSTLARRHGVPSRGVGRPKRSQPETPMLGLLANGD